MASSSSKGNHHLSTSCGLCSSYPEKTAELLVRTGRSDYYYCRSCLKWSKKDSGSTKFTPVTRKKTAESLTWIYMSEIEMSEANLRAGDDIASLIRKRPKSEESLFRENAFLFC